nr:ATP-binding cassette domain-containing protein [Nitrospirota bacterium]
MARTVQSSALPAGALEVRNLVFEYPLYRNFALDRLRAVMGLAVPCLQPNVRRVLNEVSFAIKPGEIVSIVGGNGAGKTSLLRVVSGVVGPTAGVVRVGGRVMALLAMGAGFRPMLTGRENLIYSGLLWGLDKRDIEALIPDIGEFSELHDALDQPYFTYSSGMQARLAFSLASRMPADIVILDETLAAGDARFVSKCHSYLKRMHASGKTILFVSHNLGEVARLSSRVIVLEKGGMTFDGDAVEGLKRYERSLARSWSDVKGVSTEGEGLACVSVSVDVKDEGGHGLDVVEIGQRVVVEMTITSPHELGDAFVFLRLNNREGQQFCAYLMPSRWEVLRERSQDRYCYCVDIGAGRTVIAWTLPHWIYGEGRYCWDAYVGPPCESDSPDVSRGHFWRHVGGFASVYGNAYLKGANSVAEMPVESVNVRRPTPPITRDA